MAKVRRALAISELASQLSSVSNASRAFRYLSRSFWNLRPRSDRSSSSRVSPSATSSPTRNMTAATAPLTGLLTSTVRHGARRPLSVTLLETGRGSTIRLFCARAGPVDAASTALEPSNRSSGCQVQNPAPRNNPITTTIPSHCWTRTFLSAPANAVLRSSISR